MAENVTEEAEWLLNQRQRQQMDIVLSGSLGKPINNISACTSKTEKNHFIFIQTQQRVYTKRARYHDDGISEKSDNVEKREQDQSWHRQQTQLGFFIQLSYFLFTFIKRQAKSALKLEYFFV